MTIDPVLREIKELIFKVPLNLADARTKARFKQLYGPIGREITEVQTEVAGSPITGNKVLLAHKNKLA